MIMYVVSVGFLMLCIWFMSAWAWSDSGEHAPIQTLIYASPILLTIGSLLAVFGGRLNSIVARIFRTGEPRGKGISIISMVGVTIFVIGSLMCITGLHVLNSAIWGNDNRLVSFVLGIIVIVPAVFILWGLLRQRHNAVIATTTRSTITLAKIYKRTVADKPIRATFDLEHMKKVSSCIACKFADTEAISQDLPWCNAPEPPEIEHNYCHTFKSMAR